MRVLKSLLIIGSIILMSAGAARADAKCDSKETGVKHTIRGKQYLCDKCVILSCDGLANAKQGAILDQGTCVRKTRWENCLESTDSKSDKKSDAKSDSKSSSPSSDKKK